MAELRDDDAWNDQLLVQLFLKDIADHIRHEVQFEGSDDYWDKP